MKNITISPTIAKRLEQRRKQAYKDIETNSKVLPCKSRLGFEEVDGQINFADNRSYHRARMQLS